MKTIALVDPFKGGHHDAYMRIFTRVLLEGGYNVIAVLPDSDKLMSWVQKELPSFQNQFSILEYTSSSTKVKTGRLSEFLDTFEKWSTINSLLKKVNTDKQIDHVFFAWLDSYLLNKFPAFLIDLIFSFKWSGLYFHPRHMRLNEHAKKQKASWSSIDGICLSKKCTGIAIHDEGIVDVLSKRLNKKVVLFPEIADATPPLSFHPDTKVFREKAKGRKIVGAFGTLSPHQGVIELIKLIEKSNAVKFFFVIAGPLKMESFSTKEQEFITAFINNLPENCYLKLDYLEEGAEFNTFVDDVDILYLVYNNFPSASNRLTKAAILKKPVLSSKRFCVGEDVDKYNLGYTVTEGDINEYVVGLEKCIECNFKSSDFEYYATIHSEGSLLNEFEQLM